MVLVYIVIVISSLALAIVGALFYTVRVVKKSNDIGDSKGESTDFSQFFKASRYFQILKDEDELLSCKDRDEQQQENDTKEFLYNDYKQYR